MKGACTPEPESESELLPSGSADWISRNTSALATVFSAPRIQIDKFALQSELNIKVRSTPLLTAVPRLCADAGEAGKDGRGLARGDIGGGAMHAHMGGLRACEV